MRGGEIVMDNSLQHGSNLPEEKRREALLIYFIKLYFILDVLLGVSF